jgi:hypothetical protein
VDVQRSAWGVKDISDAAGVVTGCGNRDRPKAPGGDRNSYGGC